MPFMQTQTIPFVLNSVWPWLVYFFFSTIISLSVQWCPNVTNWLMLWITVCCFIPVFNRRNKNNRKKPHITEFRTVFLDDVGNIRIFFPNLYHFHVKMLNWQCFHFSSALWSSLRYFFLQRARTKWKLMEEVGTRQKWPIDRIIR